MLVTKIEITLTEEHDTVDEVSRNAEAEDEGINVAVDDIINGGESLNSDDVIGVVPRNKTVHITVAFSVIVDDLNLLFRRHSIS